MIYKNVEIHNAEEILQNEDGSISWRRVPDCVFQCLESDQGKRVTRNSTGVELRFILKGERAVIRMATTEGDGRFHVYRGGVQGGWDDHEIHKQVRTEVEDFVIEKSCDRERLRTMHLRSGLDWDSEVIRIIFDKGFFKIFDIIGDVEVPGKAQYPGRTLLAYGSSITHGSNSLDMSHAWVSVLAHNLRMDARNLGMAGSCAMEPEMVEYIASEGEKGRINFQVKAADLVRSRAGLGNENSVDDFRLLDKGVGVSTNDDIYRQSGVQLRRQLLILFIANMGQQNRAIDIQRIICIANSGNLLGRFMYIHKRADKLFIFRLR